MKVIIEINDPYDVIEIRKAIDYLEMSLTGLEEVEIDESILKMKVKDLEKYYEDATKYSKGHISNILSDNKIHTIKDLINIPRDTFVKLKKDTFYGVNT